MQTTITKQQRENARELALYIANEYKLFSGYDNACHKAVTEGAKAFYDVTKDGAGMYNRVFNTTNMTDKTVQRLAACELFEGAEEYIEELAEEMDK